jgi:hypothetical protein
MQKVDFTSLNLDAIVLVLMLRGDHILSFENNSYTFNLYYYEKYYYEEIVAKATNTTFAVKQVKTLKEFNKYLSKLRIDSI